MPDDGTELIEGGLEILDEAECSRLLGFRGIGRVAVVLGSAAAVLPVNYAMVGGDIYFFTGAGLKLTAAQEGSTVSFEADEIDLVAGSGWSVLAVGQAALAPYGDRARVEALGLYPFAAGDRGTLVRIRPTILTGRRIAG